MRSVLLGTLVLAIVGGSLAVAQDSRREGRQPDGHTARASLVNAAGEIVGDARLEETPNGVLLLVEIRKATPGVRAFHIHETGRCEAPTFESAGGHFAPYGREHGFLDEGGPHAGDLPNVYVPASGDAAVEAFVPDVTLVGGEAPLLDGDGASLVMHENRDDYTSDPAGDGGRRIACGPITR